MLVCALEPYSLSCLVSSHQTAAVFSGVLPTWGLHNWKLGDIHKMQLMDGSKLITKSIYRHSLKELLLVKIKLEELFKAGAI